MKPLPDYHLRRHGLLLLALKLTRRQETCRRQAAILRSQLICVLLRVDGVEPIAAVPYLLRGELA